MRRFLSVRIFYSILTLWLLTIIVFTMVRLTGDPATLWTDYPGVSEADLDMVRERWGLNEPQITQYWKFVSNVFRGDFGTSFQFTMPVTDIYFQRLPNSLLLGATSFLISLIIGVPLGILSAVKINSRWDSIGKLVALLGLSIPGFFVGLCLILVFGVTLGWLPILGKGEGFFDIKYLIMPAFSLGWYLTLAGLQLVLMINVAVVVEVIFQWPGVGSLLIEALLGRDFPVVQGCVLMAGAMIVGINLLIDVLYAAVDPRIRIAE